MFTRFTLEIKTENNRVRGTPLVLSTEPAIKCLTRPNKHSPGNCNLQLQMALIWRRTSQKRRPQLGAATVRTDGPLGDYLRVGAERSEGEHLIGVLLYLKGLVLKC